MARQTGLFRINSTLEEEVRAFVSFPLRPGRSAAGDWRLDNRVSCRRADPTGPSCRGGVNGAEHGLVSLRLR